MFYEVINPSDPITLEAPDARTAGWATLFLGGGAYAAVDENGLRAIDIYLFGGADHWVKESGGGEEWMQSPANAEAVAKALDSTSVCSLADRKALAAALPNDPAALTRWNEAKRSSLNNICARARYLAGAIRAKAYHPPAERRA